MTEPNTDFDAGEEVKPLNFNFSKHGGPIGTIPEPSEKKIRAFNRAIRKLAGPEVMAVAESVTSTPEQRLQAIQDRLADDGAKAEKLDDDTLAAIIELCSGTPSLEEVKALPHRVRRAFVGWIFGNFSPKV